MLPKHFMGLLEPETITLFDGWFRLIFFAAGAFNLIITIESYLEKEEFYEHVIVHAFALIGALWFTCELIYIPNEIFGNITEQGGLIDILRVPWFVAMGILTCMSMGVIHDSELLTDDVIQACRVPLIILALLLAVSEQLFGTVRDEWSHDSSVCHGWKVKRWYERRDQPTAIEIIPGISINMLFGFLMVVTPAASVFAEAVQFIKDDVTVNEQITHASVVVIDLILLNQALIFFTKVDVAPVHLFTVFVNLYVAAKASEEMGSFAFALPLCVVFPYVFTELAYGSFFGDYAEWIIINLRPRTGFRFVYTVAIWSGVFAIVAWVVGWYGNWITLEVDNGDMIQTVLDALEALEDMISKFLFNLISMVNFLTLCGSKTVDPTLTAPDPLDLLDEYDNDGDVVSFVIQVKSNFFEAFNGTAGSPNVSAKRCCICKYDYVRELQKTTSINTACSRNPWGPSGNKLCDTDDYFREILLGEVEAESMSDIVGAPDRFRKEDGNQEACDDMPDVKIPKLSKEQQEDKDADDKAQAKLDKDANNQRRTIKNPNGNLAGPLEVKDDKRGWSDPAVNAIFEDSVCEQVTCAVFVAAMLAGAAASFIPFVGGAISFVVKTLAKIAWKLFRFVKKQYMKFVRMNKRRKQFRKKRRKLDAVINVVKKAKKLAAKGIQATEDLIYPFIGLFALGLVSFFSAFWRREDSGSARGILGGVLLGLLIANIVSMLLVRFIPMGMKAIASALPEALIIVEVKIHTGWKWMEFGVFSSLCSSVFWGIAMFLGQPKDACEAYEKGKRSATIMPIDSDDDEETSFVTATATTLTLPKWSGRGVHPQRKDSYEPVAAPSEKNPIHPFLDAITPIFDNASGVKRSTTWINNFLWFVPIVIIVWYAFDNGQAVFRVSSHIHSEVHGAVTEVAGEEGGQESVRAAGDDSDPATICGVVALAVKSLVLAAGKAVGGALMDSIKIVTDWFLTAFSELRELIAELVDLPDIPIWFLLDNTTLIFAFGCPMAAFVLSIIGLVCSIAPLPPDFYEAVNLDILRSLQYMLALAGISIVLSMYGMTTSLAAVPIPLFNFKIETTKVLLNAFFCNVIILVNFMSHLFNSAVPLYDRKDV